MAFELKSARKGQDSREERAWSCQPESGSLLRTSLQSIRDRISARAAAMSVVGRVRSDCVFMRASMGWYGNRSGPGFYRKQKAGRRGDDRMNRSREAATTLVTGYCRQSRASTRAPVPRVNGRCNR